MPRHAVERDDTDTVELKLRIKEPLRAALAQSAGRRGISLNAEMSLRLEQSFELREEMQKHVDGYRELTNQLTQQLGETRKRENQIHDFLLQILTGNKVLIDKDQLPKRRGEAA